MQEIFKTDANLRIKNDSNCMFLKNDISIHRKVCDLNSDFSQKSYIISVNMIFEGDL